MKRLRKNLAVMASVRKLKVQADNGDGAAQNSYGLRLLEGEGVAKDLKEAARYFKLSADQGNSTGQNSYGVCLLNGEGVAKDLKEASRYFKLSADEGNSKGQNNYGLRLFNGEGVAKDLKEAARYFKLSADQGNSTGQNNYGDCLLNGEGVAKDLKEAARYFKLSLDQGNENAAQSYRECMRLIESSSCNEVKRKSELVIDFSGYREIREVGRGVSGIVKLVEEIVTKKVLAVKCFQAGPDFNADMLFREVEVLASLNHPCIVRIVGWSLPSSDYNGARIATDFMENGSLADILSEVKEGRSPTFWTHTNIAILLVGTVLGMKYLHSKNIIHRDLKPSNLLIDGDFRIRIGDFGTARCEDSGTTMTQGVGTALYMAREILDGKSATKHVDIFALGLIMYEVLVGESVFPRDCGLLSLVRLHAVGTRPEIPNYIPKGIAGLIKRCWSSNIEERPLSGEILDILEGNRFQFYEDVDCGAVKQFVMDIRLREK
jgi:hypothetical protein